MKTCFYLYFQFVLSLQIDTFNVTYYVNKFYSILTSYGIKHLPQTSRVYLTVLFQHVLSSFVPYCPCPATFLFKSRLALIETLIKVR